MGDGCHHLLAQQAGCACVVWWELLVLGSGRWLQLGCIPNLSFRLVGLFGAVAPHAWWLLPLHASACGGKGCCCWC